MINLAEEAVRFFIAGMIVHFIITFGAGFLYIISTEQGYETVRCIILSPEHEVSWEWCVYAMSDLESPAEVIYEPQDNVNF